MAAARIHDPENMKFLVIEDHEEHVWSNPDDPDDYIPVVIHVYSLHDTPEGRVARDILGDRPAEEAEVECREEFSVWSTSSTEVYLGR